MANIFTFQPPPYQVEVVTKGKSAVTGEATLDTTLSTGWKGWFNALMAKFRGGPFTADLREVNTGPSLSGVPGLHYVLAGDMMFVYATQNVNIPSSNASLFLGNFPPFLCPVPNGSGSSAVATCQGILDNTVTSLGVVRYSGITGVYELGLSNVATGRLQPGFGNFTPAFNKGVTTFFSFAYPLR